MLKKQKNINSVEVVEVFKAASAVFWDFDGVLLDSMRIKEEGFAYAVREYPSEAIQQLTQWHRQNGGKSRYEKFRYFFTEILGQPVCEKKVSDFCNDFSKYCSSKLRDRSKLIEPTNRLCAEHSEMIKMHVVSAADEIELKKICDYLDVTKYFRSIHGSPASKVELIRIVLDLNGYAAENVWMVGDAINDYEAAKANNVRFMGFGNTNLKVVSDIYWEE